MTRDHYRSPADLTGSRSKIKTRPEDGRPDYLLDKITTVSGIRNDVDDSEGFERLVLDGAGLATQTTGVSHYYANGTSGDDANDGLSEATPKKTLQAVFDLVPYLVKHNTCVHLAGTFTLASDVYFSPQVVGYATCLIDGGESLTVVADSGGSPWAADISSTSAIGLTTAGWVVDAYAGYFVEVVSGPAIGQTRTIQGNTADTITPTRKFSVDPGAGAQFRISAPATEIAGNKALYIGGLVAEQTSASFQIQRLHLKGTSYFSPPSSAAARVTFTHMVSTTAASSSINCNAACMFLTVSYKDPGSFASQYAATGSMAGFGQPAGTKIFVARSSFLFVYGSYLKKLELANGGSCVFLISSGSRVVWLDMASVRSFNSGSNISDSLSSYVPTKLGGGVSGITAKDSSLRITGGDISGCSSHGIACQRCFLHLDGAVTGTGNGGAAVYAHSNSTVHIKHGAPPTISGTLGHLSTDGTTNATWWSTLDAGTPLAVLAEMTMAKEVP